MQIQDGYLSQRSLFDRSWWRMYYLCIAMGHGTCARSQGLVTIQRLEDCRARITGARSVDSEGFWCPPKNDLCRKM